MGQLIDAGLSVAADLLPYCCVTFTLADPVRSLHCALPTILQIQFYIKGPSGTGQVEGEGQGGVACVFWMHTRASTRLVPDAVLSCGSLAITHTRHSRCSCIHHT